MCGLHFNGCPFIAGMTLSFVTPAITGADIFKNRLVIGYHRRYFGTMSYLFLKTRHSRRDVFAGGFIWRVIAGQLYQPS